MIPKFRVWILNTKEMEEVVSINMTSDTITCEIEYAYGLLFITGRKPDGVLMQSTGLTDKNGVEIYEGDIVSTIHGLCEVKRIKDSYHIVKDNKSSLLSQQNVRVIGNIYENPELMEV